MEIHRVGVGIVGGVRSKDGRYHKMSDGEVVYYEVSRVDGGARCMVFLHGLGGDLTAWKHEREYFHRRGMSTIAIDLRGHGYSDRPNEGREYKMERFARDAVEIMESEKFGVYTLVGHCFGGMVATVVAGEFGDKIKLLILVDTSYKIPKIVRVFEKGTFLGGVLRAVAAVSPKFRMTGHTDFDNFVGTSDLDARRIMSDILHTSIFSYLQIWEQLVGYDGSELLGKIRVPTLVVEGSDDSIFPPKIAAQLYLRIKRSDLGLVPGGNHILVINNPNDLSEEIRGFLRREKFMA